MASQNQSASRPSIQDLLCLNKSEAAQNNKYSHVSAAQTFTLRETLLALLPTNPSPGLLQSLHLLHIFILSNKLELYYLNDHLNLKDFQRSFY